MMGQRFCSNCGAALEVGHAFCANCGTPVAAPETASEPVQETAVMPETAVESVQEETAPVMPEAVAEPVQEQAPMVMPEIAAEPTAPVCAVCGAPLDGVQAFCANCGTPVSAPIPAQPQAVSMPAPMACVNCGTALLPGQPFCATCGTPAAAPAPASAAKKKSPLIPILIAVGATVVLAVTALCVWLALPRVEELSVDRSSLDLRVDDWYELNATVTPDDAINADVDWYSTDTSVATVDDNGMVQAQAEGECTIIVSAGDCEVTVDVTVTDGPDFVTLYYTVVGEGDDATLASDGSYIEIDTNVYDLDDYSRMSTLTKIEDLNEALGLPDSVYQKMLSTRALDGRQTHYADGFTVSWTYHPDDGLEVLYELDD